MNAEQLKNLFMRYKEPSLFGRYIHNGSIEKWLSGAIRKCKIDVIGKSVQGRDIISITIGKGSKKILMWSQMHGNESTTTKAVFDLLNILEGDNAVSDLILSQCAIKIIPILNPDGAKAYTRENANSVDLNRDAQLLSQPESKVLREVFDDFSPDFCFNLHGQRTIFGAGLTGQSATVSFLSPAEDELRSITQTRKIAMELIAVMNAQLQQQIPASVGIYDDSFNANCVGDTFQSLHVPTVLFEAGHRDNDYSRENTRELICHSLLVVVRHIAIAKTIKGDAQGYFDIPNNENCFYDIVIRNSVLGDIAIQYEERLEADNVDFCPKVVRIDDLSNFYGHMEIDANGLEVLSGIGEPLKVDSEIDFVMMNNEKFALKPKNI